MASLEITGTERALPFEPILLNIWINDPLIEKIRLVLDDLLSLKIPLNYFFETPKFSSKTIEFLISELKLKNTLTLILHSAIPKNMKLSSIKVEGIDTEGNVKLMGTHNVLIMIPKLELSGRTERDNEGHTIISMKMEKINEMVSTFFNEFDIKILDSNHKNIHFKIIKFTEEEYLKNLETMPPIFNYENFIKGFVIYTREPCTMHVRARFSDLQENEYKSNTCELYLDPPVKTGEKEVRMGENILSVMFSSIQGIEPMYSVDTGSSISI